MPDLSEDLEAYAELAAALCDPSEDREALLAARGLDEASWAAIDEAWQARIEAADAEDESDEAGGEVALGIPPLVAAWAEAFARAQRARAARKGVGEVSFERFVEAMRVIRRGGDIAALLRRLGITLPELLAAEQRWTRAMLADEALAERFRQALRW